MTNVKEKKSFFKKMDTESKFSLMRTTVAILIGLAVAVVLILISAENPVESLKYFFLGPLQIFNPSVPKGLSWNYFDFWIQSIIPILFTGAAVSIMFSANKFNLGLEGAIMAGGLACAWVCCLLDGDIAASNANPVLCAIFGLAISAVAGALVTFVPAILEKVFGASTMVTSLMMNYVILYLSQYCLFSTTLRDPKTSKYSYQWTEEPVLTFKKFLGTRFTLRLGLFIGIAVVILAYIFLFKTKWGYKIRQIGHNPNFAKYAGVSVVGLGVLVQVIGGAIGGLGGATVILGNYNYYYGIEAQGEAEAIKKMAEAKAEAIKLVNDSKPTKEYLAIRSMEASEKMADGQATKLIIPSELQSIVSAASVVKETFKDKK